MSHPIPQQTNNFTVFVFIFIFCLINQTQKQWVTQIMSRWKPGRLQTGTNPHQIEIQKLSMAMA